jgi:hypothetical protein
VWTRWRFCRRHELLLRDTEAPGQRVQEVPCQGCGHHEIDVARGHAMVGQQLCRHLRRPRARRRGELGILIDRQQVTPTLERNGGPEPVAAALGVGAVRES